MSVKYFSYGEKETEYLKSKDKHLGEVIDRIGPVKREVDPDLFSALVHQIIGQQISNKALDTIWGRLMASLGTVSAETICASDPGDLRKLGISSRKETYIREFANKVADGSFDPKKIRQMTDEEAVAALTGLRGVGVWTAQMILLFCLERPDVLSFDDLAIIRGLCMVYHHRSISRELFEKYRRRYSPFGSVASLYLWEVAAGRLKGMEDHTSD